MMPCRPERSRRIAGVVIVTAVACWVCAAAPARAETETTAAETSGEFLARCLQLIRQGRVQEARELLEPVVAAHPDWAAAQAALGFTYFDEKRWETAGGYYQRALELDPDLHAARVPYAWCLYYLGRLEDARKSFEAYLAVDPDYADATFALGLIRFDTDDLPAAEGYFRRVVALAHARGDAAREALAHTRLGDVYLRTGDLERARDELGRSIELDPSNPKAHFKMSRVLLLLGDADGAAAARAAYERLDAGAPPDREP